MDDPWLFFTISPDGTTFRRLQRRVWQSPHWDTTIGGIFGRLFLDDHLPLLPRRKRFIYQAGSGWFGRMRVLVRIHRWQSRWSAYL